MSNRKAETKKPKEPGVRMLEERDETLDVRLTDVEMDDLHNQHLALTNQRDELEEKLAEVKANYKAQFEAIDLQVTSTRRLLNTRRKQVAVKVQSWLTDKNEVIRIRSDTGDQLGDARKARADELQEKLFPDNGDAAQQSDAEQPDEGAGDSMFGDGDQAG
jgi:hypothetical protein